MPNWKKVIVSGSDAVLRNITASSGITGSIIRAPQIIGSVQVGAPTIAATTSVATNLIEEETANGGIDNCHPLRPRTPPGSQALHTDAHCVEEMLNK